MIFRNRLIMLLMLLAAAVSCSSGVRQTDFQAGTGLEKSGRIVSHGLEYEFAGDSRISSVRDFCNYVYFQGDTLCFSIKANAVLNDKNCKVFFLVDEKRIQAERTEFAGNRVYGFSLVGSILEVMYESRIDEPFSKIALPLTPALKVIMAYNDGKTSFESVNDISIKISVRGDAE